MAIKWLNIFVNLAFWETSSYSKVDVLHWKSDSDILKKTTVIMSMHRLVSLNWYQYFTVFFLFFFCFSFGKKVMCLSRQRFDTNISFVVTLDFLNPSFTKTVLTIKLRRSSTNFSCTTRLHGDVIFLCPNFWCLYGPTSTVNKLFDLLLNTEGIPRDNQ